MTVNKKSYLKKYNWEGKTILVVEDDEASYIFLRELLGITLAKIVMAQDGRQAMKYCQDEQPDLVLLDIKIPFIDGFAVLKKLKKKYPQLPVIAQTAFSSVEYEQQCIEAGFDRYLSKPLQGDLLLKTLHYILFP